MDRKRAVCGLLLTGLLLTPVRAAGYSDAGGHWAEPSIERWSGCGVVVGSNGAFYPDNALTRAELAVILDRIFGWQTAAENTFADLADGTWYTGAVLRANAAGVLLGDGEKVYPEKSVTRQEAAVMLSRTLRVSGSGTATNFGDRAEIADWAVSAVNGMTLLGFFRGGDDGNFDPLGGMTRAETVTVLDRAVANYYNAAGSYSGSVSGLTVVAAPGVTLQSMTVDGDLIIAPGANVGEVILSDVAVTGQTYIQTGSSADVILSNSSLGGVTVEGGGARVTVRNGTEIETLTVSGDGVSLRGLPEDMGVTVEKDAGGATVNGRPVSSGAAAAGDDVSTGGDDVAVEITIGGGSGSAAGDSTGAGEDTGAEDHTDVEDGPGWYYINENGELVIDVSKMPA